MITFFITAADIIHVFSNDPYFASEDKDSAAHEENTKT